MKFLISTICLLFFSFVIQAQNDQLELEWAHSFSSDRWDAATSVRADNSGNVVVAGFFSDDMDFDPGPGEFILSPVGDDNQAELSNVNGYLQKLDGEGNLLWAISHLAGDFPACCVLAEQKTSVYIAPNDDIFVLSNVNNSIDLDPGPGIINFGEAITQEWVIQKFSPDGELIWVKTTNLTENNGKATCLSIDNEGNLFLGGLYNAFYCLNLGTGCSAVSPFYSSGNLLFISKLNGSTGDLIWSRIFEGISQFIDQQTIDSDVLDIAIDPSTGNATIAGWFIGALQISPGVFWNWAGNSDGQKGYLITMNGSDGQTIWAEQFNDDPQFDLYIQDVAYDGMSRLYARGRFPQENGFGYNDRTVIYDSQGAVLQYIYQDPSAQRERNTILHVNPDGSFLLSGMLSDTAFGRERHKANIYNTSWQLEVQHQFFGPFYIYSTHWANAAFNSNGEVFLAGGYSQSDYDADASADGEFILPIGDCSFQACSEAFVQKVAACPGTNSFEAVSICAGSSYTFPDGTTIENIQSDLEYVSNLGIVDGCETTITTTLTVQVPYFNATDNYLCSGESFTMPDGGVWVINESISQTFNYFTSSGCDSTIVVNIFVESPPSLTASYDCLNDQLLVNITDMGTFQGQTSPPWNMTALGLEPSETIIIEGPGLYTFPGANPNQSYRLALFEPNNCAPDYFIYPNCNEAPCGDSALEQIDNGNFDLENDNSWTQSSTLLDGTSPTGYDVIDATFIYDNSPLSAWFGGFNSGSITSIQQDIYLPSITEITNLTWWERYNGACSSEDVFTISLAGEIIYQQVSADEPNCGSPVWHRKSIDISSFATGTTLELTLSYVQTGTNGYSSLFLDNLSVLSCPCSPQIENQTVQVCYGGSYTFPNGATIDNITEGFDQYSYFSPPPCLTGIITTVEIIPAGCTDPSACNFDPTVACDDGSCCSCEADFNGDGSTNTTDLIILIEDYGCNLNCGNSDMNNDGSVNSADVLIFLNSFGSSCF